MPKAGNMETEAELKELTTGKSLRALGDSEIKQRLKEIHAFLTEKGKELQPETVKKILESNGFLKEITKGSYIGATSPKAVQVLTAAVMVGVCEATAPEFVFEDEKTVVRFLLRQFHHLEKADKDSETYKLMYYVVETVSRTGLFALLADVKGADELMGELFDTCINKLAAAADSNSDVALMAQLEELLKGVIEEMNEITEELMSLLLGPLSTTSSKKSAAGQRLVKSVMRRLESAVLQTVCTFVTKNIETPAAKLAVADKAGQTNLLKAVRGQFTCIMQLSDTQQSLANTLLPVIVQHLSHANTTLRLLATNAMCRVFEMHTTYYTEYPIMFNSTLRKFLDKSKDIRIAMADWAVRFLPKHKSAADAVGDALKARLLDQETEVRKVAMKAVVSLANEDHELLGKSVLEAAFERIRDKKTSVRGYAMHKLSKMYSDLMLNNDKAPPPFNTVPTRMLEVYPSTEAEVRREIEKILTHTLLPAAEEEENAAVDSISNLTCVLIKMWNDLSPASQATFSKLLRSKKPIRDLMLQFIRLRPLLKKGGDKQKQAHAAMHQVINQLHQACALGSGLENLLMVKDEVVFEELEVICKDPVKAMGGGKKVLKAVEAALKKDAAKKDVMSKQLIKNVEVLLVRLAFPVDGAVLRGVVQCLGDVWQSSDGKRVDALSHLLYVLVSSFPEVCREADVAKEIIDITVTIAEAEADHEGWGGEDEDAPIDPPKNKRQKVMTLRQRRSVLLNLLQAVRFLGGFDKGMVTLAKAAQTKTAKAIRKLCLNTTDKVTKPAVQVLHLVAVGDVTAAFDSLCEDCFKKISFTDISNHKTVSMLRVLQQSLLLSPSSTKCLNQITKLMTTTMQALYKKDIKVKKSHSFANPPLDCEVYNSALRVFVAYVTKLPKTSASAADSVKTNYKILMKYCEHTAGQEDNLAKTIQTTDTTKAILKLGRDKGIKQILFTTQGMPMIWQTLGYMTRYQTHPEARAEVGRVLSRDIVSGKLPMQFMQLLVMTLVDGNRANYAKAKERVEEAVGYYRMKCKQYGVKLEQQAASGLSPEYVIPPLVHLLARWNFLETLRPSYEPIQRALFVLFDKLTEVPECVPFLFDLLGRLKALDDSLHPNSTNTRLICDIAFVVLRQVTSTKQVDHKAFPGVTYIPNLFKTPEPDHESWAEALYIDERKFVPVTRKNDKGCNPMDLLGGVADVEQGESPKGSKKRAASPVKKTADTASKKSSPNKKKASPASSGASPSKKRKAVGGTPSTSTSKKSKN